jgi:flagellar biosynthesis/type III secretory pathway protein FliH
MRLSNLKKVVLASVFGISILLGTGVVTNAQTRWEIERQRRIEQQRRMEEYRRDQQRDRNQRNRYYRVYRNGSYYQTDNRGVELLRQAINRGYQEGFREGQMARRNRRGMDYYGSNVYRNGTYGYQSYVDRSQYQYYFQQGFQRGYEDGYNSRYQYGTYRNGVANILGSVISSLLNIRDY